MPCTTVANRVPSWHVAPSNSALLNRLLTFTVVPHLQNLCVRLGKVRELQRTLKVAFSCMYVFVRQRMR